MIAEVCDLEQTQHLFLKLSFFYCFISIVPLCLPRCRAAKNNLFTKYNAAKLRIWELLCRKTIEFEVKLCVRISVPCDVQIRPFMDRTTADDSTALMQSMTCKTIQSGKWNFQTLQTVPAPTSLCSPTAHRAALLCYLCAPSCAARRAASPWLCFDVSAVSVISPLLPPFLMLHGFS